MKTKVLQRYQISSYLLELIEKAEKKVVLITPYINVWGHLTQTIETALKRKVRVEIYHRYFITDDKTSADYELDKSLGQLQKMGVHCYEVKNLHTKLYFSNKSAIMTSMNLYEHSAKENEEIGLYTEDDELLKQFQSYYKDLKNRSKEIKLPLSEKIKDKIDEYLYVDETKGCCIRCEDTIEHNLKRPMCINCYNQWKEYKEYGGKEKYCHGCSDKSSTTMQVPICNKCKEVFEKNFGDLSKHTVGSY